MKNPGILAENEPNNQRGLGFLSGSLSLGFILGSAQLIKLA
jgi:hypothetical protein